MSEIVPSTSVALVLYGIGKVALSDGYEAVVYLRPVIAEGEGRPLPSFAVRPNALTQLSWPRSGTRFAVSMMMATKSNSDQTLCAVAPSAMAKSACTRANS